MNFIAVKYFRGWVGASISRRPYVYFRIAFASIWLLYDLLDLWLGGIRGALWNFQNPAFQSFLVILQSALILSEVGLLIGWKPRAAAFVAFALRGLQAFFFPLNDFFYFCISALLLCQADCGNFEKKNAENLVPAWPRDMFILQTAWMYFSTALLKINQPFLSGGDLFVRQNYLRVALHWPYPYWYATWIKTLSANSLLAYCGIAGEFSLAGLLLMWWAWPKQRAMFRPAAIFVTVMIHLYGALGLNVFFFSASMIAQVALLTWEPQNREG